MISTPRNKITGNIIPSHAEDVDTLYEIADAEFGSDKSIFNLWNQLSGRHKEFRQTFANNLMPRLLGISMREHLIVSPYDKSLIAYKIAQDWWDAYHK